MTCDPSSFFPYNVTDTCAIWNLLSSSMLFSTARTAKCQFSCTYFVYYECLVKKRTSPTQEDLELQKRFSRELEYGSLSVHHLNIDDLHELSILEARKRFGKGELSSMLFAQKTRQAFLTDDQGARKLAERAYRSSVVQTTPHLLGWLIFSGHLSDRDVDTVITQHEECGCNLRQFFQEMYHEGLRCRYMTGSTKTVTS